MGRRADTDSSTYPNRKPQTIKQLFAGVYSMRFSLIETET
ncbi:MAG: hypothetical protein RL571_3327 [Pseudomonadota bacterium]|jgi:hypothetical protein